MQIDWGETPRVEYSDRAKGIGKKKGKLKMGNKI